MSLPEHKTYRMAAVCGFCRGVKQALRQFQALCEASDEPVYVLHELVHNCAVTEKMRAQGAVFVERLSEVPPGARLLIGAHGVSEEVERQARSEFRVEDATCPRVKSLQRAAASLRPDQALIMLCKKGHPEAVGVIGHAGTRQVYPISGPDEVSALPELSAPVLLVQTTMSGELTLQVEKALQKRFSQVIFHGNICNASEQRQQAVSQLARQSDLVLVVGSQHSSNAAELVSAAAVWTTAYLIENAAALATQDLAGFRKIGVSAGASTPDELIDAVRRYLEEQGYREELG